MTTQIYTYRKIFTYLNLKYSIRKNGMKSCFFFLKSE